MTDFPQVAPVANFFFMLLMSLLSFSKLCLSMSFCQLARVLRWLLFQVAPVADFFSQVLPVADFSPGYACRCFFPGRTSPSLNSCSGWRHSCFFQLAPVADFFYFRLRTLLTFFPGRALCWFSPGYARRWFFFSWLHDSVADFFFRLRPSMTDFPQVAPVANFFFMLLMSLLFFSKLCLSMSFCRLARVLFFTGLARRWFFPRLRMSLFFSGSHESVADFFFRLKKLLFFPSLRPSLIFSKLWLSLTFLAARASPSLTSFFWGCARRWHFSHLAPVADYYFRLRTTLTFHRSCPSLIFPQVTHVAVFFRVARVRRWILVQVEDIAVFSSLRPSLIFSILGCAHCWLFSQVAPFADFPLVTHVADFFFLVARFRRWLLFQIAPVDDWFSTGRPCCKLFFHVAHVAVIFLQVVLIDEFLPASSLTFFHRSCPSLIFPQVTHVAVFFRVARVRRWLLFQVEEIAVFSQLAPVADFFQVVTVADISGSSRESVTDFLFLRLRPSLTFFTFSARRWLLLQVAHNAYVSQVVYVVDFFFSLRTLLIFYRIPQVAFFQVAQVVRWLFFQVAPFTEIYHKWRPSLSSFLSCAHRWLLFQVAHIAAFFTGHSCRWLLFQVAHTADFVPRSRPSLIFPQVTHVAVFFFGSHESVADFFFRLRPSLTFPSCDCRWLFLAARTSPSLTSFSGCARRWHFSHLAPVADFYIRLRTLLTFFPGCARCWFFPRLRTSLIFFLVARFHRWLLFQIAPVDGWFSTGRPCRKLFSCCWCRCFFSPSCAYRLFFAS